MNAPLTRLPLAGREADTLRFIERFLTDHGYSPTMDEIAAELKVSDTRAKQLVHKLAMRKAIERVPGTQRGITVPGLFRRLVVAELRRGGMTVDEDFEVEGFPKGQLPLMPDFPHIVDDLAGDDDDGGDQQHRA